MRKPEITKKTSTPMKPPWNGPILAWSRITSRTARARSPWMSCRKPGFMAAIVGREAPRTRFGGAVRTMRDPWFGRPSDGALVDGEVPGEVLLEAGARGSIHLPLAGRRDVRRLERRRRDAKAL